MDLLVAALQGLEPYGLYQYGSLVDRKRKDIRSVAPVMTLFQSATQDLLCLEFVYKNT
jgi:hypothetical protein